MSIYFTNQEFKEFLNSVISCSHNKIDLNIVASYCATITGVPFLKSMTPPFNFCRQSELFRIAQCLEVWQQLTTEQIARGIQVNGSIVNNYLKLLLDMGVVKRQQNYWIFVSIKPLGIKPLNKPEFIKSCAKALKKKMDEKALSLV